MLLPNEAIQLFIPDGPAHLGVRLAEAAEPISPDYDRSQSQGMFSQLAGCGCFLANILPFSRKRKAGFSKIYFRLLPLRRPKGPKQHPNPPKSSSPRRKLSTRRSLSRKKQQRSSARTTMALGISLLWRTQPFSAPMRRVSRKHASLIIHTTC